MTWLKKVRVDRERTILELTEEKNKALSWQQEKHEAEA